MNSSPKGRSVVWRMLSKSSRVPPSISLRSCQSICRQPGLCDLDVHRQRHALQHHRALRAAVPMLSTWARSGTVRPSSMSSPPQDRSTTTRALRLSGNV